MENHCKFLRKEDLPGLQGTIAYNIYSTDVGPLLIASWKTYICYIGCTDNAEELFAMFSQSSLSFEKVTHSMHAQVLHYVFLEGAFPSCIAFGTFFENRVWSSLLEVSSGSVTTYADLAKQAGYPKAVRAVGTAVGRNKIALLIPCHRVIRSDGTLGEYHWGKNIKKVILEVEMNKKRQKHQIKEVYIL